MDDIVRQALAKWPNVPHCHGWLALDARGNWRTRDEHAQAAGHPGDPIRHPALLSFINRNYLHDEQGCWYFQNGPQRVYVTLEATPFIARTDPLHGFVLHTGQAMDNIDGVWLSTEGQLVLRQGDRVAQLDDRDMAQCLALFRLDGAAVSDEQLLSWLQHSSAAADRLRFAVPGGELPVQRIRDAELPGFFGYVRQPLPRGD